MPNMLYFLTLTASGVNLFIADVAVSDSDLFKFNGHMIHGAGSEILPGIYKEEVMTMLTCGYYHTIWHAGMLDVRACN